MLNVFDIFERNKLNCEPLIDINAAFGEFIIAVYYEIVTKQAIPDIGKSLSILLRDFDIKFKKEDSRQHTLYRNIFVEEVYGKLK